MTLLVKEGLQRLYIDGQSLFIEDIIVQADDYAGRADLRIVVDRAKATDDEETLSRLGDSVATAFLQGDGVCNVIVQQADGDRVESFSSRFELDGIVFEHPSEHMFSFNNPIGACPRCEGYGKVIGIDEDLVVPDRDKALFGCDRMLARRDDEVVARPVGNQCPEIRLSDPSSVPRTYARREEAAMERQ